MSRVAIVAVASALSLHAVGAPSAPWPPTCRAPCRRPTSVRCRRRAPSTSTPVGICAATSATTGAASRRAVRNAISQPDRQHAQRRCHGRRRRRHQDAVGAHRRHHRLRAADEIRRQHPRAERHHRQDHGGQRDVQRLSRPRHLVSARRPISAPAPAPLGSRRSTTPARPRRRSPATPCTSNGISPGPSWPASAMPSRPISWSMSAIATSISATSERTPMRSAP